MSSGSTTEKSTQQSVYVDEEAELKQIQEQKQKELEEKKRLQPEILRNRLRQREEQKRIRDENKDFRVNILLMGSKHLASWIVFKMHKIANITIVDTKFGPDMVFQNPFVKKEVPVSALSGRYLIAEADLEKHLPKILEVKDYDFVINTIFVHDELYSATNNTTTYNTNVGYTQSLMNVLTYTPKGSNIKNLHMSTDKVYGNQGVPQGRGEEDPKDLTSSKRYWTEYKISENDYPNPKGIKAISRYAQEMIVEQMCKTYGMDYMIFRVGNLMGQYSPPDTCINQMYLDAIRTDAINFYGDKFASRDFVNIETVADLVTRVLVKDYDPSVWSEIYNIGSNYPTRMYVFGIGMFIQTLISGTNVPTLDSPEAKNQYIKDFGSVRLKDNPPRCYEDREDAAIRIWLDVNKAKEKLNFDAANEGKEWYHVMKETLM